MNRKVAFTAISIGVFMFSAVLGSQTVQVAWANPVMESYPKSPITDLPIVTVVSPENNSYVKSVLFVRFNVTKPDSWGTIGNILQINFTSMDGQEDTLLETTTVYDNLPVTQQYCAVPTGLKDGLNTLFITIKSKTWYYASGLKSYEIVSNNTLNFIIDNALPQVKVIEPNTDVYNSSAIPLTFTVNRATSMITYSLDDQYNTVINGNTTLAGLSNGNHTLVVHAYDTAGNAGSPETQSFIVNLQTPTPFSPGPTQTLNPTPTQSLLPTSPSQFPTETSRTHIPSSSPSIPEFPTWTVSIIAAASLLTVLGFFTNRKMKEIEP